MVNRAKKEVKIEGTQENLQQKIRNMSAKLK